MTAKQTVPPDAFLAAVLVPSPAPLQESLVRRYAPLALFTERFTIQGSAHRRGVENRRFAVWQNADGPSREVIVPPIEPDFHCSIHVVV